MKKSNDRHLEETVLRELFRTYDRNNNGILTQDILKCILEKLDLTTSDEYLTGLLNSVAVNGNGDVEFEEFCSFVIQDRYTSK